MASLSFSNKRKGIPAKHGVGATSLAILFLMLSPPYPAS